MRFAVWCVPGSSVIDWLLKWHFAEMRYVACRLAQKLLNQAHIVPLLPSRDKKSAEVTPSPSNSFCDSTDVYYRFVSITISCCMFSHLLHKINSVNDNMGVSKI